MGTLGVLLLIEMRKRVRKCLFAGDKKAIFEKRHHHD